MSGTSTQNQYSLGPISVSCTGTTSRTYDGRGHLTAISGALEASHNGQSCFTYYPPTNLYQWGPNDKLIRVGIAVSSSPTEATPPVLSSATFTTAHWDGDSLLFDSLSNGSVRNVNFDGLAEVYPSGIGYSQFSPWTIPGTYTFWVYDYNQAGGIDDARVSTAPHATYNATTPAAMMDGYFEGPVNAPPLGLDPVSRDVLSDATIDVSGVRTIEPGTTQWSTPDAANPSSASAYMWDNNNPYMFRDPSGYAACSQNGDTTGATNNNSGVQVIGCVATNPTTSNTDPSSLVPDMRDWDAQGAAALRALGYTYSFGNAALQAGMFFTPGGDFEALAELGVFREELLLQKGKGTLARLDIGDRSFHGINAHGQPITLMVNAISKSRAETDAFQQALNAGVSGGKATLTVDRELCDSCGKYGGVASMARQLGIESLTVRTPNGSVTLNL